VALLATAQALTTGTPTPTPMNMVTATPTPVFVLLDGELPLMTPTPTSTVVPKTIPSELIGKIAFKSDRTGEEEIYVINPDGSGLALLSDRWPYELALARDAYSADERFRVFVKDALIDTAHANIPVQVRLPALFFYDTFYEVEEQITRFNPSLVGRFNLLFNTSLNCQALAAPGEPDCFGLAFQPAWSPIAEQIAFVSNDSRNDEIWVINRDGSDAHQLTRDDHNWWDKHPSWSPDGSKIVFWSNRTGNFQIWVMNADGSNLYSLSRTGFNDWDPVWIKYPDIKEFIPPKLR
jgi:Tol biopolymer transport system component